MRPSAARTFIAAAIAAAALTFAIDAPAQVVRGDVTDAASHAPIFGAIILVFDTSGTRVGGAISDDSGRFSIRLTAAGSYRLRAERIGYAANGFDTITVARGAAVVAHLTAASAVVMLPAVYVSTSARCVIRPTEGAETAVVWEEARKALDATEVALDGHLVYAVRKRYKRDLDGTSLNVRSQTILIDSVTLEHPWQTSVSPEDLARVGYGVVYDGDPIPGFLTPGDSILAVPDANVLLSDAFARTHCFKVRHDAGDTDHAGLIGLTFSPAIKRSAPDVTGTLWLDSATALLKYMEFRHTNLFAEVSPRRYGGRMDFELLPGGIWVVRSWTVRLPVMSNANTNSAGMGDARYITGGHHVAIFHDDGGELLSATVVQPPARNAPVSNPPSANP
jgi:hypothetical protein